MSFGLTNTPAMFQCIMNSILEAFLRKCVIVFTDDILVYSTSLQKHVAHLSQVPTLLRSHNFYVKRTKCAFAQTKLECLGHIISADGVATDPKKTQVTLQWLVPTNVTKLRGFLGLIGYYHKFVHHYGSLAKPLANQLKKKHFQWSEEAQFAFDTLKKAMSIITVLALPDFNQQFTVEIDACDSGMGVVLMQKERPIAFLSKPLAMQTSFCLFIRMNFLHSL
jgi:hypothetical protein